MRVRGNKTRCSIDVQLWDEDPGRPSKRNALTSDITQPCRVACSTHGIDQNSELILFRLHLPLFSDANNVEWDMGIVFLFLPNRSGMQGNFLGQVALGWDDLDLHPCDSGRDLDLGLKSRDGGRARDEQPVQGTIQLRLESLLVFEVYGWEERGKGSGC